MVTAQARPVWDVAPGFALVREAGGKATLWSGKEQLDVSGNSTKNILASNGPVSCTNRSKGKYHAPREVRLRHCLSS